MLSSRSTPWVVLSAFTSACRGDAGTADAARLDLAWKYDSRIPEAFETSPIVVGQEAGAKSDLSPEESRLIAADLWAISQTRGEPWPGGRVTHGPEAAQGAQPGRPGS